MLGVLTLLLASAGVFATNVSADGKGKGNDGATKWAVYYEGEEEYAIMMGPGDNSAQKNPNFLFAGATCWGLGPNMNHRPQPQDHHLR